MHRRLDSARLRREAGIVGAAATPLALLRSGAARGSRLGVARRRGSRENRARDRGARREGRARASVSLWKPWAREKSDFSGSVASGEGHSGARQRRGGC